MIIFKALKECLIDTASVWALLIVIPIFIILFWTDGYNITLYQFLILSGLFALIPTTIVLIVFLGKYRMYVMLVESRPALEEMKKAISNVIDEMFKKVD